MPTPPAPRREEVEAQAARAEQAAFDALTDDAPFDAGLAPAVEEVGRQIAQQIREVTATTAEADPGYELAGRASWRFAGWSEAARTLHGRPGVDLRPVMREILELARVRSESLARQDVARVSGFYAEKWG